MIAEGLIIHLLQIKSQLISNIKITIHHCISSIILSMFNGKAYLKWWWGALEIHTIQIYSKCQTLSFASCHHGLSWKMSVCLKGERCHSSGTQKEIQVLSGLLQHPLRDTNMQSEISEEVDMGTALLRTWSFAIWERVHSEKVSVFRCINVSDLEVRGREEMGGGGSTGNFILWQKKKTFWKPLQNVQTKVKCRIRRPMLS